MSNFPCHRGQLKSKGHGTLSIYFAIVQETIETIFRTVVSANRSVFTEQFAKMCEEYETLHDRSGRPGVVVGQSIVLNAIKTDVLCVHVIEIGQYFMIIKSPVVNTLQEMTKHHNQEDGSKDIPKMGPCWKLQTSHLHGKHRV